MTRYKIEMTHLDDTMHEFEVNSDGTNLDPPYFGLAVGTSLSDIDFHIGLTRAVLGAMNAHLKHLEITTVA